MDGNKWVKILANKNAFDKVLQVTIETNKKKPDNPFLFTGIGGRCLLNHYMYKITKDGYFEESLYNDICIIRNSLQKSNFNPTFSHGHTGIFWLMNFLSEERNESLNFIDREILNNIVKDALNEQLRKKNYDLLLGAIGYCQTYLLNKKNDVGVNNLLLCLNTLKTLSIKKSTGGIYWNENSIYNSSSKKEFIDYNLGLAHGIPSILVFLGHLYRLNIEQVNVLEMINGIIIFLHSIQQEDYHVYPGYVTVSGKKEYSKLSWCYGDLGVSIALIQVGLFINDSILFQEGVKLATKCAVKINEQQLNNQGMLCHGASGVAHIFNRIYHYSGISIFKETAISWFEHLLKLDFHENGIAGYLSIDSDENENRIWVEDISLLNGSAGIGLALLAAISDEEPKWDRCLLLS